jgi:hypothetical protein
MAFTFLQITEDSHQIASKVKFGCFRRISRISSVSNGEAPQPLSKGFAKGECVQARLCGIKRLALIRCRTASPVWLHLYLVREEFTERFRHVSRRE